jgi:cyanophycinase-like exopeptidase
MDGLNEPTEPRKMIAPDNWEKFLQEFAERNYDRRARFDVFRNDGTAEEEGGEAHLEDVKLTENGGAKNVEIIRIDRSQSNAEKTKETVTNVRGITVQIDIDGSEDALEITDDQNTLVSLRLESKIDGNS